MYEETKIKSSNLTAIEAIIQEYSIPIAKQYRLKPHQYRISLVAESKDEVHVIAGPVVQIVLQWPAVQPFLNSILKRNFNFIINTGMLHSMALQPYSYVLSSQTNYRGWLRKNWGEVADVLLDLLPKKRIKYRRRVVIEAIDVVTGIVSEVEDKTGVRSEWDMKTQARSQVSRAVRDLETVTSARNEREPTIPKTSCTSLVPVRYYKEAKIATMSIQFSAMTGLEFSVDRKPIMELMDMK